MISNLQTCSRLVIHSIIEDTQLLNPFFQQLETEKYDFDKRCVDQKYEVNLLRFRSNMLAGQSSKEKTKRIGRLLKK